MHSDYPDKFLDVLESVITQKDLPLAYFEGGIN